MQTANKKKKHFIDLFKKKNPSVYVSVGLLKLFSLMDLSPGCQLESPMGLGKKKRMPGSILYLLNENLRS